MMPSPFRILILTFFTGILYSPAWSSGTFTNSIGMTFTLIPAGTFQMGSPPSEKNRNWDETLHTVTLTRGFYISITEVTQIQWFDVMGTTPSASQDCGGDCPVENVSWNDVQEFVHRLNAMEQTRNYRLPTEAEWEYASRAGTRTALFTGPVRETTCHPLDPAMDAAGWYCGNTGYQSPAYGFKAQPVARKNSNAFGLHDTHGNVMEWCLDACTTRSSFTRKTGVFTNTYQEGIRDPLSRYGSRRVVRGGAFFQSPEHSRNANRSAYHPDVRRSYIGFRLVRMQ